MNTYRCYIFFCLFIVLAGLTAEATLPTEKTKKVALVIGNAAYPQKLDSNRDLFGPLVNPREDAIDMAELLKDFGFEVSLRLDADFPTMDEAESQFIERLKDPDVAVGLFYFSGHGGQARNLKDEIQDYLIPISERPFRDPVEVRSEALSANDMLRKMRYTKVPFAIMILDACRAEISEKGGELNGLGSIRAQGTLVAYAAEPGKVAKQNRSGRHSVYTESLLRMLREYSEQSVEVALKKTAAQVAETTKREQVPWQSGSLLGDFCLGICRDLTPQPMPDPERVIAERAQEALDHGEDEKARQIIIGLQAMNPQSAYLPRLEQQLLRDPERIIAEHAQEALDHGEDVKARQIITGLRAMNPHSAYLPRLEQQLPPTTVPISPTPPSPSTAWTDPLTGMEFVWIPKGSFKMGCVSGSSECRNNETPVHRVELEGFWLGKYEVTQGEWEAVMGENPSFFNTKKLRRDSRRHPVEKISWNRVQTFLQTLNERSSDMEFRLPSEAEWEFACRAGSQDRYSFGNDVSRLGDYAWYSENSGRRTHRVGGRMPNAFGVYDMHGNVWEWCADSYESSYDRASPAGEPRGGVGDGQAKVLRGGSWYGNPGNVRSADRHWYYPVFRNSRIGFRLVVSPRTS